MRFKTIIVVVIILIASPICIAGFLDNFFKDLSKSSETGLDDSTIISGLKEALSTSTENAVKNVSQVDGYLANEAIKILMPEKIQKVADVLTKIGYQKPVDDFITSMNHAAERAAPKATTHFISAIKEMSFDDAKNILNGGDTAATEYFQSKTSDKLYDEFKPIIASSMDQVGATRSYKEMMGKYTSLPFMKEESFDLDHYVSSKALEGLFATIALEEKKIRTDPAARATDLLKTVFGKQ